MRNVIACLSQTNLSTEGSSRQCSVIQQTAVLTARFLIEIWTIITYTINFQDSPRFDILFWAQLRYYVFKKWNAVQSRAIKVMSIEQDDFDYLI